MKSAETEVGHVADVVARMAVSRPDVAFSCTSDGRDLLRVQRSDLQRRLGHVVGKETSAHLHHIDSKGEQISVSGFISGPALVRSGMQAMFTYINGRFVRDKVVQHAILQAYRGVIDRGRYPVVALFIQLPPGEVDVNVHPTKHEVRFRHQSVVHDTIQSSVENILRASPWLAGKPPQQPAGTSQTGQAYRERIAAATQTSLNMHPRPSYITHPSNLPASDCSGTAPPPSGPSYPNDISTVHDPAESFQSETGAPHHGYFSSHAIIGQFHGEYILCQSGPELVIIDQHAASERVAYQRLKQQHLAGAVESQRLLFPEILELSFSEVAVAERFRNELTCIGFELEPFGGNTLMIAAVPRLTAEKDSIRLVRDILSDLSHLGASAAFQDRLDDLFSRIACHSVVRGVHPLDMRQMTELLRSMDETDFAASCPHGRPVSHVIQLAELEKIFKRT
jgi:DNA mismatch repair protein MutL